jgi:hypothetical protein
MIICKNCGVELEPDMQYCPLCQEPIGEEPNNTRSGRGSGEIIAKDSRKMTQPQRKITWEIASIIILLIIMVTSLLNFIINRQISWASYPIALCLVLFSYVSVFAFIHRNREIQIGYVFIMSSLLLLLFDFMSQGLSWSIWLAIPLLFLFNSLLITMMLVFRYTKRRGINLIAFSFLAAALLSLGTEALLDLYLFGSIHLVWSLIVLGCVLPIVTVLLFMHFRLKIGNDLNKTFHI